MSAKFRVCKVTITSWLLLGAFAMHSALADPVKIGLVLDKGGKDDKSFNSAAFEGLMKAKDQLKAYTKYVESTDDNAFEPLLRSFAQKNFDLVVAVGFSQVDALKKVSAQFPNIHFVLVDGKVDAPNVRSLLFAEHEGSYVVGAIAALTSKSHKVGFVGGMDVPLVRRFQMGYEEGAKKTVPGTQVSSNYIGVTGDSWNNPAKAKELAVTQYESGVDVIFQAAGASGTGIFDAAEEKHKYAIGVDSNQDWIKPGYILTSMVKKVDEAVFKTCQDFTQGKFTGGVQNFGLSNRGVDYTSDSSNATILTDAVKKKADQIKTDIISGKIKVADYYKTRK